MKKPPDVTAFWAGLEHPHLAGLKALRAIILAASKDVTEGVKWNAPSYRLDDDFATFHLRGEGITLVLHSGARSRRKMKPLVDDPTGALVWRGDDRALLSLSENAEVRRRKAELLALLRSWIAALGD